MRRWERMREDVEFCLLDDGCVLQMVGETFSFIDKSGQSSPLRFTESHKTILNRLLRSRNEKCSYDELYILYGKQDPKIDLDPARAMQDIKGTMDPRIRPYLKPFYDKEAKKRGYHIPAYLVAEDIELSVSAACVENEPANINNVISLQRTQVGEAAINPKSRWRYKIMLLDDVQEMLQLLESSLESVFKSEDRYEVDFCSCDSSYSIGIQSRFNNIDLYVLDVARKAVAGSQIGDEWYFGGHFLYSLISERPEVLTRTKIIFYTKLPRDIVYTDFGSAIEIARKDFGVDIDLFMKQKVSPQCVAMRAKEYLDELYEKEHARLERK